MQQFSNHEIAELKSRVDQIHELLASRGEEAPAATARAVATARGEAAPKSELLDQLSFSIQIRRIRRSHFGAAEMSGPVWGMMLDLMLAAANGRALGASDLATGAGVPLSSGLRMIAALEGLGFVHRSIDERDRRRTIVRLTDSGTERMASYFEKIGGIGQAIPPLAA
ncbi:MAG TPA: winged helix DNA-binding protein [Sphingopyxis sp.]|nr:winged helix DNA-binding protein [Sphingopyxis sp.]